MAIKSIDVSTEQAREEQLGAGIRERGTAFEDSSKDAAKKLKEYIKEGDLVDLGCGDGAAYDHLKGFNYLGVDINQEKLNDNPGKTQLAEMGEFLSNSSDFDVIFCHHALEHTPNPTEILALIGVRLKQGGYSYIEVPANDHIHSVHYSTFDEPGDLLPPGTREIKSGTSEEGHYMIAREYAK